MFDHLIGNFRFLWHMDTKTHWWIAGIGWKVWIAFQAGQTKVKVAVAKIEKTFFFNCKLHPSILKRTYSFTLKIKFWLLLTSTLTFRPFFKLQRWNWYAFLFFQATSVKFRTYVHFHSEIERRLLQILTLTYWPTF